MTASPEEIKEMERLNRIMKGDLSAASEETPLKTSTIKNDDALILTKGPTDKDIGEMARILNAMNNTISNTVHHASGDAVLQEALVTKPIDNGISVGNWKIKKIVKEGITKKDETFYKISGDMPGQNMDDLLMVHESANAIVRLLGSGVKMNDSKIKNIIELDQEYQRLRQKALEEKVSWYRVNGTKYEWKQDLYEAKFDAAKSKALYIRERIKNIMLNLK